MTREPDWKNRKLHTFTLTTAERDWIARKVAAAIVEDHLTGPALRSRVVKSLWDKFAQ